MTSSAAAGAGSVCSHSRLPTKAASSPSPRSRNEAPPQVNSPSSSTTTAPYLEWIKSHPHGYAVNAERRPTPAYLQLHNPSCPTISGMPTNGRSSTAGYSKTCAPSRDRLERWAAEEVGGSLEPCL